MRRTLAGMAAVASLLASSAFAASPVYDWTGFYAGANVGYSWGRSSTTQSFSDTLSGAALSATANKFDMDGAVGGGQIGYNWQRANWVFGFEGDIQASAQRGSGSAICLGGTLAAPPFNGVCTPGHIGDTTPFNTPGVPVASGLSEKLEWFGTVRGRVGPTLTPTILAYVTGGLAYGEVSATNTVSGTNITGTQAPTSSF